MSTKKLLYLSISLILVFAFSFGSQLSLAQAGGATITGRVVDQNGSGIGGVLVLSDNGEPNYSGVRTTTTNPDGSYSLQDVQTGSNHLQAKFDGLALSHYWNFDIAGGQTYSTVNFILRPGGGRISGRVVDSIGAGVGEALVNVFEQTAQGFNNGGWAMTETDANGFFTTSMTNAPGPGLPTGTYTVMASKSGLPAVVLNDVDVTAGYMTSDVVLSIVSGTSTIAGQITNAAGGPVIGAEVLADNGVVQTISTTDQSGFYQIFNLPTGTFNVVVYKDGYANAHRYHINAVDGTVTSGVDFSLTTNIGQISGRVVDMSGQPIVGAVILADSDQGTGFGNTTTNGNGEYLLTDLAPMKYYVHATATDLSGLIVMADVFAGATTPNIDFSLGMVAGGISGKITKDGLPAGYATVYVNSSSGSDQMFYRDTTADGNGNYLIQNLPPGTYDVHVYGVPGYTNLVRYFLDVGDAVVTGVDFNLANGSGVVDGHVMDLQGNSVAGATVQLFQQSNPGAWASATTNGSGYYSISGLWPGDYHFYADHAEFPTVMKSYVPVVDNEPARVDLVLGQDRALVADPNGLSVTVEKNYGTYESVLVEVSSGAATLWTAQSQENWLLLGNSGEIFKVSGQTGLDALILRFDPTKVAYGTHTAQVVLTAPDAQTSTLQVTMSKIDPDAWHMVFLPMIGADQ